MRRDNITEEIFKEIQADLYAKYGIEFTTTEIYNIVDSQFEYIPIAMEKKQAIKLNHLGKFTIKKGREEAVNSNKELLNSNLDKDRIKEILKARAYHAKNVMLDFRQNKEDEDE